MEQGKHKSSWHRRLASRLKIQKSDDGSAVGKHTDPTPVNLQHPITTNLDHETEWKDSPEPVKAQDAFSDHQRDASSTKGSLPDDAALSDLSRAVQKGANPLGVSQTKEARFNPSAPAQTPDTFWGRGYAQKKAELPDLILAYEALVAEDSAGTNKPVPGPASVVAGIWNKILNNGPNVTIQSSSLGNGEYFVASAAQMATFIDDRLQLIQDKSWKIPLSQKTVDIQKQAQRIVRGILYVKDSIGALAALDPHASLAWAGVCLMLPLICDPYEQKEMLLDGLDVIVSTLCRLTVSERLYREELSRNATAHDNDDVIRLKERFEMESVGLVANIIEYQAKVACHTCRGPLATYVRAVVKADDWKGTLRRITQADDSCSKLLNILNEQKYDRNQRQLQTALEKLDKSAATLTNVQQLTLREVQQGFEKISNDLSELQIQEILEALANSNYEKHKRVIPEHVVGTCKWFTEHHQYLAWKTARSDVLWLAADPGCGKSVLAKFLVEEEVPANEDRITCYFFFKDGLTEQQGLEKAVCALLHQLFVQKRSLIRHALKPFLSTGKQFASSVEKLWGILVSACSDPLAGEVILIVDALDECEIEDRKELVRRVSNLYMFNDKGPKGRTKFLLTSRPYHNINVSFQQLIDKLPHVHLSADQETAAIRAEIDVVVDHRVTQLATSLALDAAVASQMSSKLKAAQNRTYLWVRLIFEALEAGRGRLAQDRAELLDSIPSTVQEAYASILQKCVNPGKARNVFQIMLAAQKPLAIQELNVATSINVETKEHGLKLDDSKIFREDIRQACGLFVSVIDGKVYFIHQTAREFLTMQMTSGTPLPTPIGIPLSMVDCHKAMAMACTQYLPLLARRLTETELNGFNRYAARFWDLHVAMTLIACDQEAFDDVYEWTLDVCDAHSHWWRWRVSDTNDAREDGTLPGELDFFESNREARDRSPWYSYSTPSASQVAFALEKSDRPNRTESYDEIYDPDFFKKKSNRSPQDEQPITFNGIITAIVLIRKLRKRLKLRDQTLSTKSPKEYQKRYYTSLAVSGPPSIDDSELSRSNSGDQSSQAAEIVALSFIGLVGLLWLACIDTSKASRTRHRRRRELIEKSAQPMLQWLLSSRNTDQHELKLVVSRDDPLLALNGSTPGCNERSYKIFWDFEYLDSISGSSQDPAASWTVNGGIYALAHDEGREFLTSIGDSQNGLRLNFEASQAAVAQAFIQHHVTSASLSKFQQLLQRASAGVQLRELGWRFPPRDVTSF